MLSVGKTRNERLADHYLEASGVAGIWIDDTTGEAGALRVVTTSTLSGKSIFCLASFPDAMALARECFLYRDMTVEQRAEKAGIALTAHSDVIDRARWAVDAVNAMVADLQRTGGMRTINAVYKEARKAEPGLRYQEFLHRQKEMLLAEMARGA
mgnify:CR=1 FL=1